MPHKQNGNNSEQHAATPQGLTPAEIQQYRRDRDREKLDEIRKNIALIHDHIAAASENLQRVREYLSSVQRPPN